ncbi:formate-dependent phosphoribosylglycinamide formyltransferase [Solitalea koreensis]|uniref:Formate-dependent phosphoribosylglycinamide formyltransferase n=1 Tax=Solitalea koreensis TaxID=543615 RepID=A0A521D214_9SPHI|nr:formate-dependent phosphoribosylglycinamide formyltransferase [Solitalea koreensis]SMO65755.1 formate-dependent phosphoribosylglycinamide formyltransferase [Solitalea koreensis]
MYKKIMLLGSGELGKEFVIAAKRLGQYVIAVDSYQNAPAMQVADEFEVINMLDGAELDRIVVAHQPDIIVPEVEAIRTEQFYKYEQQGVQVVPSAKAANFTMNRKQIRDLAAQELGLVTAKYLYASTSEDFKKAVEVIGIPCVVKPIMSSSGKGQSIIRSADEVDKAWDFAMTQGRGKVQEVIIEEFIRFDSEITLLTVTQQNGPTLFCSPIGHRQERGDYMESWQPALITEKDLSAAKDMAAKITEALGGAGLWGVEFFLTDKGVYFSELSPRPHDTGMVTLAGSQNFSEFELHARAVLGLPIPEITLERTAASYVVLASEENNDQPTYDGLQEAAAIPKSDFKIFGKPYTKQYRRMAVALAYDTNSVSTDTVRERAKLVASKITVNGKYSPSL